MPEQMDWEERGALTRARLDPLRFLVGAWRGEGVVHGAAVTATLDVEERFEGTFLEARERLVDAASGALAHEDVAFYRYEPRDEQLRVTQYMAYAWTSEEIVVITEGGARWYAGPLAPRVELRSDGADGLIVEVWQAFSGEPDSRVRYSRRVD